MEESDFYKKRRRDQSALSMHHMRTPEEGFHLHTWQRTLPRHQIICQHLDLGLPGLQNFEELLSII